MKYLAHTAPIFAKLRIVQELCIKVYGTKLWISLHPPKKKTRTLITKLGNIKFMCLPWLERIVSNSFDVMFVS